MKNIILFILIVLCSVAGTGVFLAWHYDIYSAYSLADYGQVLMHSLPQHLSVAGYVLALPLLVGLFRIWKSKPRYGRRQRDWFGPFMAIYMAVMAVLLVLGWMVNLVLYGFWGIVLDSTVLIYVLDNPMDALAESPWWALVGGAVLLSVVAVYVYRGVLALYRKQSKAFWHPLPLTLGMLLLCGLDFLAIRGGWSTATMNPGRAYFSTEMALNHAAVDPVFNFLYSLGKNKRFDRQYRFMTDEEATAALAELEAATHDHAWFEARRQDSIRQDSLARWAIKHPWLSRRMGLMATDSLSQQTDSGACLLRTQRPNILLVLLESFSGAACTYLTPEAEDGWMPSVNQAMADGVAFTRFYANSFRTDRGVAAALASYPGQPTNSVMKDQSKCDNLQYLSQRLAETGYRLQFVHGGDVNFTNMQGFLRSGGFTNIIADRDFPLAERLDKWGVRDDQMFDYVARQVIADNAVTAADGAEQEPFFKVFLSLSSHEPFEVPYQHYDDPYLNSVAYADSCLGAMIDTLRARPEVWDNLLIIGLPDHCYARFPATIQQHDPLRYHIPMFWTGGAIRGHRDIATLGQQTDLSATLLGQLGVQHEDFGFSKDLMDPTRGHYAFYAFSDGFGMITDSCSYVQDNNRNGEGLQPGTNDPDGRAERWGKAYLQRLYDDLQTR